MFDLKQYINFKSRLVDDTLREILHKSKRDEPIDKAMRYSLMAGGKRIRPVLCLAAAEAVGGNPDDVLTAACAMEMIHTYSLIHDDLPAMDDDDLRRGKPTCHVAFNEATAILAGDALLTLAFETLASAPVQNGDQAARWLKVIRTIAVAAGSHGMIQGQMLDIAAEGRSLTVAELETIPAMDEATFTFAHFLKPHEPIRFDRDGNVIDYNAALSDEEYYFFEQLHFINTRILEMVDRILEESSVPPIIILQADHGSTLGYGKDKDDQGINLEILNAFYLPGYDSDQLYPAITPVNSFRVVFNLVFGTEYPLLEERFFSIPKSSISFMFFLFVSLSNMVNLRSIMV